MKKLIGLAIALTITTAALKGQQGWEAGGWAGIGYYFGDLNTSYYLGKPRLSGGIIGRYNFNERVSLKVSANYIQVEAADSDSRNAFEQARNLSFRSAIFDISPQVEFNFLPYIHGSKDQYFTPYLFAGFSVFSFNPEAELDGEWIELRPLGTEGQFRGEEYFTVSGAFNYGLGFKFDLNSVWSVNVEMNARSTFTDYLDDVSTVYPDKDDLLRNRGELAVQLSDRSVNAPGFPDGQIGQPGRQRGNSENNDHYVTLGVGIVYYFGDLRCPKVSGN